VSEQFFSLGATPVAASSVADIWAPWPVKVTFIGRLRELYARRAALVEEWTGPRLTLNNSGYFERSGAIFCEIREIDEEIARERALIAAEAA